jgi:alpha-glucosidase (family GH31 glycosyl hydrolase)
VYPDFFKPETVQWWKDNLKSFYSQLNFDGLWLDMNEASNFCNGACYETQMSSKPVKYMLPYTPTGRNLEEKSIAVGAQQMDGKY